MLAQGFLSPIDTARAKLQEQIGNFLAGRAKLLRLQSNANLSIQGQARGLYAVQLALETRLQNEITPIMQKVSSGTWDMSDIITLTGFTITIIKQIGDVASLERQAGVSGVQPMFDFDMTTVAIGGVILIGLGIMSGMFFGRGKSTQV